MVQLAKLLTVTATLVMFALATDSASAHSGEAHDHVETEAQVAHRKLFHANAHRSLKACANAPHFRKLKEQAIARRVAKVERLRQETQAAGIRNRRLDASTVLAQSHKSSLSGVTTTTDAATLFGSDPKCVLQPEVTEGPYYVKGELIRSDTRESQAGIDLYVELQVINVNTCTAVENLYVDFWHCNTTGVYAGVVASGNGNSADATNIDKTFNRGLAPTDASGLVNFTTTFPGHYTGRATHIHVLGTHGGTVLANNTYSGGSVSHVGQLFFDQDLLTEVQATTTYAANTQTVTTNAKDSIFSQSAASGFDPVLEYALLGDSVEDGIFAWVSIGVDMTISKSVSAAATLTSSGGTATSGGTSTGGGGNAPGGTSTGGNSGTSSTTSQGLVVSATSVVLVIGVMAVNALLIQ